MVCLHLARIAVFPHIAGLRKDVVSLQRLRAWVGFLRLSLKLVECLLGDSKFVHNGSSLRNLLRGLSYLPATRAVSLKAHGGTWYSGAFKMASFVTLTKTFDSS